MGLGIYTFAEMTPDPRTGGRSALPRPSSYAGAFLTGTVHEGRETLRACILNPETGLEHLETVVAEILASARELA